MTSSFESARGSDSSHDSAHNSDQASDQTIPATAADQVEFVSITGYNAGSELNGAAGGTGQP